MRSMLTCLQVAWASDPSVVERAEYAWSRLSNACHQHAFELSPTAMEAATLAATVVSLMEAAADKNGEA